MNYNTHLIIRTRRTLDEPNKESLTVGQLKALLEDYPEDMYVFTCDDPTYVYGILSENDFEEQYFNESEDEDDE